MVEQFQACEFWLPPQFLTDEDFDFQLKKKDSDSCSGFGSSGSNSEVSSLGESESDEDEYITGLTRLMANSTLQEEKGCRLSSSPKSPLCKAAGEFSRRKTVPETPRNEQVVPMEQKGPSFGFPANLPPPQLSYQQLLAIRHLQFQQVRRHQMMNQTQQNIGVKNGERVPMGVPVSAWPQLQRSQPQPQPGTGMRAVFLGNNAGDATKPRAGTGVFLPRTAPSTENRKTKHACSPVLIPDRVVQALNLNLETLDFRTQYHHRPGHYKNNGFSAHRGAAVNYNSKMKKNPVLQSIPREEPENQEVFRLPQEWTY